MKIIKEKRKVVITLSGGAVIKGVIHINEGERILDYLNDMAKKFIPVTDTQNNSSAPKTLLLNRSFIQSVEEL